MASRRLSRRRMAAKAESASSRTAASAMSGPISGASANLRSKEVRHLQHGWSPPFLQDEVTLLRRLSRQEDGEGLPAHSCIKPNRLELLRRTSAAAHDEFGADQNLLGRGQRSIQMTEQDPRSFAAQLSTRKADRRKG